MAQGRRSGEELEESAGNLGFILSTSLFQNIKWENPSASMGLIELHKTTGFPGRKYQPQGERL